MVLAQIWVGWVAIKVQGHRTSPSRRHRESRQHRQRIRDAATQPGARLRAERSGPGKAAGAVAGGLIFAAAPAGFDFALTAPATRVGFGGGLYPAETVGASFAL